MPKLTKIEYLEALRAEIDGRKDKDIFGIVEEMNAPEVIGYETRTVETNDAYEALSAETMLALDEAAGGAGDLAGEAIWFLSALADVEPVDLSEGSCGAQTLVALTEGGIIPAVERDALIAAAQQPVLGPSWGQRVGIGRVDPRMVQEVLD